MSEKDQNELGVRWDARPPRLSVAQEGEMLCVCGHPMDLHGNDGAGHCGASRSCRAGGGCKKFRLKGEPEPATPPPALLAQPCCQGTMAGSHDPSCSNFHRRPVDQTALLALVTRWEAEAEAVIRISAHHPNAVASAVLECAAELRKLAELEKRS